MFSKGRRFRVLLLLGVTVVVIIISAVYLVHYYGKTRPTVAQAGRPFAVKIHERTVYLTRGEYALAFATHAIAIIAMGVFIGTAIKSRGAKK